jgi:hypothetical protein
MIELDPEAHTGLPWRIHAIAGDFTTEDVWRLPMNAEARDFDRFVQMLADLDPVSSGPRVVRVLAAVRLWIGGLFKGDTDGRGAARNAELVARLPDDLSATSAPTLFNGADFPDVAITPLFKTNDEWAVAIASGPVDGILHIGWVADDRGHQGQLAVLVKRRGLVGRAYMAAIAPARRFVVYPLLARELRRRWNNTSAGPPPRGCAP